MPCYAPLVGYYSREIGASGKRGITFDRNASHSGVKLRLPCGQCIGCRVEKSRQWAMRMMHEYRTNGQTGAFLTLTYGDQYLPHVFGPTVSGRNPAPTGTLVKRDLQLFMKRLRKVAGDGLRFYGCGEYGDENLRPHYHVLLLNYDFRDKRYFKAAPGGEALYSSHVLDKLWTAGFALTAGVSFDSCAYVAGYVTKKITGKFAEYHYNGRAPEFAVMSNRPGLGSEYYEKYGAEVRAHDTVVFNGREVRPPRFYDTRTDLVASEVLAALKVKRRRVALRMRAESTPDRRRVREIVALKRQQQKVKKL